MPMRQENEREANRMEETPADFRNPGRSDQDSRATTQVGTKGMRYDGDSTVLGIQLYRGNNGTGDDNEAGSSARGREITRYLQYIETISLLKISALL